jgi:spermidine/putrescine transport system ATP-binding protein/putrescine transport system ATP-binding protein
MQLELKRLQHEVGITFVVVTHDQEEAMTLADRIAVMNAGRVEQIAPPVTLYRKPASVFVGDFIGTSNLFSGTRSADGVDVPGVGDLPGSGDVPLGVAAHLLVRPESIRVVTTSGSLAGQVIDSHFVGGRSTLAVRVPGHDAPVLVSHSGADDHSPGDDVRLDWDADAAVVLP